MTVFAFLMYWKYLYFTFFKREGERGREGEREGEKHQCERKTLISYLSYIPWPGTEPATKAYAPSGNRTGNLSLWGFRGPTNWATLIRAYLHYWRNSFFAVYRILGSQFFSLNMSFHYILACKEVSCISHLCSLVMCLFLWQLLKWSLYLWF